MRPAGNNSKTLTMNRAHARQGPATGNSLTLLTTTWMRSHLPSSSPPTSRHCLILDRGTCTIMVHACLPTPCVAILRIIREGKGQCTRQQQTDANREPCTCPTSSSSLTPPARDDLNKDEIDHTASAFTAAQGFQHGSCACPIPIFPSFSSWIRPTCV